MEGRIRGLGTSESWFSLVYRAIVLFSLEKLKRGQYLHLT
jgi:hypothetical protein